MKKIGKEIGFGGLVAIIASLAFAFGLVLSPGTPASAAPEDEVDEALAAIVAAWNDKDAATFISLFTERGIASLLDYEPTVEAVQADMEETGPIASAELVSVEVQSLLYLATVDIQFEAGFDLYQVWTFQQTPEGWVVRATKSAARPIPAGVPAIEMELREYSFVYNKDAVNAADGNFAFSVTNAGQEQHEIVIVRVDSDKPLLELLQEADPDSEEPPAGIEFVAFGGFFERGDVGSTILADPLTPGKYALLCFVEAPDGTPHAFLGMVSEFSIGSGPVDGGVTPPSTGNAGLLANSGSGSLNYLMLGVALIGAMGLTAAFARMRLTAS